MKRVLVILLCILLIVPAAAKAEATSFTAHLLDYSAEMEGWNVRESIEEADVVARLYCEYAPADAVIRLVPRSRAATVNDLLTMQKVLKQDGAETSIVEGIATEPVSWMSPWGVEGATLSNVYVYISGDYISDLFRQQIYAAPYSPEYYLSITLTTQGGDHDSVVADFEGGLLAGKLNLHAVEFTDKIYGYLREAKESYGRLELAFDTFIVEGGDENNEPVFYNNDPSLMSYGVAENGHIWTLASSQVFQWERKQLDAAQISAYISEYVISSGDYPTFVIYLSGNEIVWMEEQTGY